MMVDEEFEMCDGAFSYVGGMDREDAVIYFNHLMKQGIFLDPDCAIDKLASERGYSEDFKKEIKRRIEKAFDEQNPIYGSLVFEVVCYDRETGQFDFRKDFEGRVR